MESRREALKTIGSVIAIVAISLVLLMGLSTIFQPKDTTRRAGMIDPAANGIMAEPAGTIDVLIVGDSEGYSSFSPLQIWGEHGITSYVCATSGQRLPYANTLLHRGTEHQRPRVVIIETNMLFSAFSIDDLIGKELERVFPVLRFHDRWKGLGPDDLSHPPRYRTPDELKGFQIETAVRNESVIDETVAANYRVDYIPGSAQLYLRSMVEYCRSIGATPVLMAVPSAVNYSEVRHDAVQALADELGVDFIDMNVAPNEVAIDWSAETFDGGDHLNLAGAQKVTAFVGGYLAETFALTDHRGDSAYGRWNELYEWYLEQISG